MPIGRQMLLIETTDRDFADLIEGRAPRGLRQAGGAVESAEVLTMLRELASKIRPRFDPACWMMVENAEIVGLCSIIKVGPDGSISIGYGVSAERRKRGFASAAVRTLVDWARSDTRVQSVKAETSVDNRPSQRVLEKNGFARTGERFDEGDGDLICWSIPTPHSRLSE